MKIIIITTVIFLLTFCFNACSEKSNEPNMITVNPVVSQISTTFTFNLNKIEFYNSSIGYAVGDSGAIIKTINGGDSWQVLNSGTTYGLNAIEVISDDHIVVGGFKKLLYSSDGGSSWNEAYSNLNTIIFDFDKIENNIWTVGGINSFDTDIAAILKSSNNGLNWFKLSNLDIRGLISSILIIDQSEMIFGLERNIRGRLDSVRIYKTTDGGNTFYPSYSIPKPVGIHSLSSYDNTKIFASGPYGNLMLSTNRGDDWTCQNWQDSLDLYSIHASSNNLAFSCGKEGTLILTDDGGSNWSSINSGSSNDLKDIASPIEGILIIVGHNGTILKIEY